MACALLFLISFAVAPVRLCVALQFVGVIAAAGAVPGLRASMLDVVPADVPRGRGVGLRPHLRDLRHGAGPAAGRPPVGPHRPSWRAFYIVFPPIIVGLLLLLRARHTVEDDARAIVTAIYEENQILERQRAELAAAEDPPEPVDAG